MEANTQTIEDEPISDEVVEALTEIIDATGEIEVGNKEDDVVEDSDLDLGGSEPDLPDDICYTCFKLPDGCKCEA